MIGAVARLGDKAVPRLVAICQSEKQWDAAVEGKMYSVFNRLGDKAAGAIEPLSRLAGDEAEPSARRFRAIRALGAIGPSAILQFVETGAHFPTGTAQIDNAGASFATVELMRTIAELRGRAVSAGSFVAAIAGSEDWEARLAATRTIGRISYSDASDALLKLLKSPDDWRLVYGAAESLGMLKHNEAVSPLAEVSKAHWYPPVREVARHAIETIQNDGANQEEERLAPGERGFPDLERIGRDMETVLEEEAEKVRFAVLPPAPDLPVKIKADATAVQTEQRRAVAVDGGYLVARDYGEFGGDISFVDADGNSHVVVEENTHEIYKMPSGIFAVSGLAHMGYNSGFIYKIEKAGEQRWTGTKWRALPGAPRFSRVLKDGRLFVSCFDGIVLVTTDGEMKSVTRSECLRGSAP